MELVVTTLIRTYSELIQLPTFNERLKYLQTFNEVGIDTFGPNRIFNQKFYTSTEWRKIRNYIIARDNGCDLAVSGCEIPEGVGIRIHHLNPLTINDLVEGSDLLLNPEYLVLTTLNTHNIIHFGLHEENRELIERTPNDTCPWKRDLSNTPRAVGCLRRRY